MTRPRYFRQLLSADEERELAIRWRDHGDEAAMQKIIVAHEPLLMPLARKLSGYGVNVDDLVQEGQIGLLLAAKKFEPERGLRFSTYATWWARAAMQDYVHRNLGPMCGASSTKQKLLFFGLRGAWVRESAKGGDVVGRIARQFKVGRSTVMAMEGFLSSIGFSLETRIRKFDGSTMPLSEIIECPSPRPDEVVIDAIDDERLHALLVRSLRKLDKRDREVIEHRLLSEEPETLEQVGKRIGVSKERVRQLEIRALRRLREWMVPA